VSKQPIAWHRECYRNSIQSLHKDRHDLQRLMAVVEERDQRLKFYARQIEAAVDRGMDEFDRDRLLVKQAKK
jgi:hypothetical protein